MLYFYHASGTVTDEKSLLDTVSQWFASVTRYVTGNMTGLIQKTRPECESEFEANGYPIEAQFLEEYTTQMNSMDESVCCYDLQAVALFLQSGGTSKTD